MQSLIELHQKFIQLSRRTSTDIQSVCRHIYHRRNSAYRRRELLQILFQYLLFQLLFTRDGTKSDSFARIQINSSRLHIAFKSEAGILRTAFRSVTRQPIPADIVSSVILFSNR